MVQQKMIKKRLTWNYGSYYDCAVPEISGSGFDIPMHTAESADNSNGVFLFPYFKATPVSIWGWLYGESKGSPARVPGMSTHLANPIFLLKKGVETMTNTTLIPITRHSFKNHDIDAVNARDLHEFLGSSQQFSDWIQNRINDYSFEQDRDFFIILCKTPTGGRPRSEYIISIDMAKELCMVERNDRGRQARLYFIECERRLKETQEAKHAEAMARLNKSPEPSQLSTTIYNTCRMVGLTSNVSRMIANRSTQALTGKDTADCLPPIDMTLYSKQPGFGNVRSIKTLREIRESKHMKQSSLSQILFDCPVTYGEMERGNRPMSDEIFNRALAILGVDLNSDISPLSNLSDLTMPGYVFEYITGLRSYLGMVGKASEVEKIAGRSSTQNRRKEGELTMDVGRICGAVMFDMCVSGGKGLFNKNSTETR